MSRFKKTYIEITNVCNLACNFCPKVNRASSFMGVDLFERILAEIKDYSKFLYFHVMGEPLLHPMLGDFLDLSNNYGFQVNMTTNGTLIKEKAEILISKPALRQVNFSLHSHEANHKGYPLETYLDDVLSFIKLARSSREILICLRLWNTSPKASSQNNRNILSRIEAEFSLPFKLKDELSPCRGIKLAEGVFLNQASSFEWPLPETGSATINGFCYGLRDQLAILVDGSVVPCCLDSQGTITLGNITHQHLSEIIEGKRAKNIYDGFSRRQAVEELCKNCTYRHRFDL